MKVVTGDSGDEDDDELPCVTRGGSEGDFDWRGSRRSLGSPVSSCCSMLVLVACVVIALLLKCSLC